MTGYPGPLQSIHLLILSQTVKELTPKLQRSFHFANRWPYPLFLCDDSGNWVVVTMTMIYNDDENDDNENDDAADDANADDKTLLKYTKIIRIKKNQNIGSGKP